MNRVSRQDAVLIRKQVQVQFNKLKWLPHTGSDRMWATKNLGEKKGWKFWPKNATHGPCPQLAVNPRYYKGEQIVTGCRVQAGSDAEGEISGEAGVGE
jgi:hypothetical protein